MIIKNTWTKASGRDSKTINSTPKGQDVFSRTKFSATWKGTILVKILVDVTHIILKTWNVYYPREIVVFFKPSPPFFLVFG
jgi:hypothetical protein